MSLKYSELSDDYDCAMGDIEDLKDQVSELESQREQITGDIVDLLESTKKLRLAYMGYNEEGLEIALQHISRMAEEYANKEDRRPDAREWWDKTGVRKDITKMGEADRMMWAYRQGLIA